MSIIDKVTGKVKQALGDVTKDPDMRHEGIEEERKGEKKEEVYRSEAEAERHEAEAERKAEEVEDIERRRP